MFSTHSFNKNRVVCEDHFEESCFVRNMAAEFGLRPPKKTLKADAVPTIFIHNNRQSTSREASRRSAAFEKMEVCLKVLVLFLGFFTKLTLNVSCTIPQLGHILRSYTRLLLLPLLGLTSVSIINRLVENTTRGWHGLFLRRTD